MTLERKRDEKDRGPKIYGRKRKRKAIRKAHLREKRGLEKREALGATLTDKERARLELLKDTYD